jgi:2-oxoglutarate ferredoxin oxidoreductase subunit beta
MDKLKARSDHPLDALLRTDRIPHIWCSGCGIGTVFASCLVAMQTSGIDLNKTAMVSGIGCSGRGAGYIKLDSYHTTHGRAIPFATGMKLANPELNVVVFSGDGDLFAIGGNHFIHAARRNIDLTVICVNNLNYGMTGGQQAPSTPFGAKTTTSPTGSPDQPFNFCGLAAACGASYVARWTALHIRLLTQTIGEALSRRGFSFIEILAPCPTAFGRRNKMRNPLDLLRFYYDRSLVKHSLDPSEAVMDFQGNVIVGKFVDAPRPTWIDGYRQVHSGELGEWPNMATEVPIPEKHLLGA